jgi:hypothetical protein
MISKIKDYLKALGMGQGENHKNMTVFPLFFEGDEGYQYLCLDAALEKFLIEITEVSESGDVPNLKVSNKGEIPILILAGEELVGAKQNRIVNATFLVAGHASIKIPVSCVEAGRWHYRGKAFQSGRRMSSPQLRTKVEQDVKFAMREGRGFRANQGEVWNEIAAKSARMSVHSPTAAMSDIYESYGDQLKHYTKQYSMAPNQKGFLVFINNQMAGMEVLDSQDSLANYFDKMMQSYALDAIDLLSREETIPYDQAKAQIWVEEITELSFMKSPSLGLGEDFRLESSKVIGSGLMHEGKLLYLSGFAKAEADKRGKPTSGMDRASRRGSFSR